MIEKHVLLTNLMYVTIGDVRTNCHAILLESARSPRGRCKMRGFGTEAAWPVFDLELSTIEYVLQERAGNLDSLVIAGAPKIGLWRSMSARPIAQRVFEWDNEDNPRGQRYEEIWRALEESVADHWDRPYMPRLVHMPPCEALRVPSRAAGGGS